MKPYSNAHRATSYILIDFEPYKAISARDIEPSPLKIEKFMNKSITGGKQFILEYPISNIDPLNVEASSERLRVP